MSQERERLVASYDAVALEYARRVCGELDGKPLDRALLEEIASRTRGLVCDLGCGPGHVAQYLHQCGCETVGIDISPAMISEARRRYPGLRFEVADVRSLPHEDGAFSAMVAMYSLINFDASALVAALTEIRRVLVCGGILLVAFHAGNQVIHVEQFFDSPVDLEFHYFQPEEIKGALMQAELDVERVVERDPYPDVEVETRRFYVIAHAVASKTRSARRS